MSTPPPDLYIAPTDWLIDKIQKELDVQIEKCDQLAKENNYHNGVLYRDTTKEYADGLRMKGSEQKFSPPSSLYVKDDYSDYVRQSRRLINNRHRFKSLEWSTTRNIEKKHTKIKRGLSGFINKNRVSAVADTGSAQNVISAAYATDMKVLIDYAPSSFQLGNSKTIQSIGTVTLPWAFAEDPTKIYDLLFHVLPTCIYDVILGSDFLTATETLSKYGRRLTECVFSMARVFKFGFLGNRCQRLQGIIDDKYEILALPDTGAERNVMDAQFAKIHGFCINTGPDTQNTLQFADGSFQDTIGQVTTSWTFRSGERALLTFEVLEDCASEVVVGEDFIFSHNIFQEHQASLLMLSSDIDSYELAPFDFISSWQQKYLDVKSKLQKQTTTNMILTPSSRASTDSQDERLRRDIWNHKFEFGSTATAEEMKAETKRRKDYEESRKKVALDRQRGHVPRIPSIPTASSGASRPNSVVRITAPNFSRPLAS